ncbi:MAG: dihydrofolate reductase [Melioribacteraceae bacterium]|nr:dihydrofolate reductase [Melioribacteraceae bacterium]
MEIIIIAAIANNNIIGKDGTIPWHSKEDFKHFKETTLGFPIIMGRKTFQSIGKPLVKRKNIIITRDKNYIYNHEDVFVFNDLINSIEFCRGENYEKVFIIGGAEIYIQALKFADRLIISHMKLETEGDTFFPEFENEWKVESSKDYNDFILKDWVRK